MSYSIWLEFEQYADPEDHDDGYCNVIVIYDDGRRQGYNVWTLECFQNNLQVIYDDMENKGFSKTLPDIIVSRLERQHISEVLEQVLPQEEFS